MNELDLLRQFGLLTPADEQRAREQSVYASLGGLAQALMAPRQRGQSALAQFGQAALQGYQAGEQSFDQTLQGILRRTQLQDLLRQRQEQEKARQRQALFQQRLQGTMRQVPTGESLMAAQSNIDPAMLEGMSAGQVGQQAMQQGLPTRTAFDRDAYLSALAEYDPQKYAELMMRPEEEYTLGENQIRYRGGRPIAAGPEKAPDLTTDQKNYKAAQAEGYKGTFQQFMIDQRRAGASQVQVGGEMSPFGKAVSQKQADVFSKISETSQSARRNLGEIDRLGNLLNQFQSGGAAAFKQFAGNFGIDTKNLSEIQAAEAIISRLVPQQRPPNSGPMSDADLIEFKKSLPRIINRPGANQIIIKTLKDIANYQIKEGEIADMVMDQEITPAEGRKRLRELVNPIDTFFAGGVYQQYGLEPRR